MINAVVTAIMVASTLTCFQNDILSYDDYMAATMNGNEVCIVCEDGREYTFNDIYWTGLCVICEAYNQDNVGRALVADVVLNRMDDKNDIFPGTAWEVLTQEGQFRTEEGWANEKWRIDAVSEEEWHDILVMVAEEAINRTNSEVLFYRTGTYHSFGTPVLQHQDHYFSKL